MATKLAAFFITFIVNLAIGVAMFFFMIIAMNGFSESDANYGLGVYIILAILVTFLMSSLSVLIAHLLMRRDYRGWVAMLISVPIFSVIGGGLKILSVIIGLAIADYVRVNY